MNKTNMMLMSDFYKQGHPEFYPKGMEYLFTCGTPRMSRLSGIDSMVVWGAQAFAKEYLIENFNQTFFKRSKNRAVNEVVELLGGTFDCSSFDKKRLEDLWDLQALPIRMWAIPEGTEIPIINQKENPGVTQVPFVAFENTNPKFAWVAEFLESIASCQLWYPMTIATVTKHGYRNTVNKHWKKSVVGQPACTAISEFGFRGAQGAEGAIQASSAFLTSFTKTATVPAIPYLKHYYGKGMTFGEIGGGMSSTEHSVMCSNFAVDKDEKTFMERLLTEIAPKGNLSVVSDSYDYWKLITEIGKGKLKEAVENRDGCMYIRGDSGDPVDIICGTFNEPVETCDNIESFDELCSYCANKASNEYGHYAYPDYMWYVNWKGKVYEVYVEFESKYDVDDEGNQVSDYYFHSGVSTIKITELELTNEQKGTVQVLWDSFGGTVNSKGYRVLAPCIRAIYGDSITPKRAEEIYTRLEAKGFAANNVALGAGSFSMQAWEEANKMGGKSILQPYTRDTFGIAFKATYCEVNGKGYEVYKDPKTDTGGFKKSQRGMVVVLRDSTGKLYAKDGIGRAKFEELKDKNVMRPIFENGKMLVDESLDEIRQRLHGDNW